MEDKQIKIKMTTLCTDSPVSVVKANGRFMSNEKRTLITFTNEAGRYSVIVDQEKISVSGNSPLHSYRIPIKENETLKGIMGEENTFLVIGKRVEHTKNTNDGTVVLEYTLPDLSDKSMDFKVNIEYKF